MKKRAASKLMKAAARASARRRRALKRLLDPTPTTEEQIRAFIGGVIARDVL